MSNLQDRLDEFKKGVWVRSYSL